MKKRSLLPSAAVLILIGSIGILQISRQPRFANFHNVDVLQLLASGMCFGVALAMLVSTARSLNRS